MKKLLITLLLLPLFLTGCDNNEENVKISTDNGWYINTSESITVSSFNKYRLIDSDMVTEKDGSIVVTLKFNTPFK